MCTVHYEKHHKKALPETKIKLVTIIENDGSKNFVVLLLQQKIRKVPHLVVFVSLIVSDLPLVETPSGTPCILTTVKYNSLNENYRI